MGRLLRKKIVVKKKKEDTDSPSDIRTGEKTQPSAAAAPEPQKKILPQKKAAVPSGNSLPEKVMQFLREVRAEYRKVTWPSRKQTVGSTVVVIVVVMIISAFLGMIDMGLSSLIRLVLQ